MLRLRIPLLAEIAQGLGAHDERKGELAAMKAYSAAGMLPAYWRRR